MVNSKASLQIRRRISSRYKKSYYELGSSHVQVLVSKFRVKPIAVGNNQNFIRIIKMMMTIKTYYY